MKNRTFTFGSVLLALILVIALVCSATAETAQIADPSPAIGVFQNTQSSVVGVITNDQSWNRATGETVEEMIGQGSGVVIKEGGYILTNNHVVEVGSSFQVLLPSGEKADAKMVGTDAATDLAVIKVETDELLTPVRIGTSKQLPVGSTVIAIGNPGGAMLANTVTMGVVSALEREVDGRNTQRDITYIQHDAAINSGNSGGGLFDVNSQLVGINTLKYVGSVFIGNSSEGLGFAIPVDTAYPIAMDLIDHGKVRRPQIGVEVADWQGPDEPMNSYPPASICIYRLTEGGSAIDAGLQPYDFITAVNGTRVKTLREMTRELDKFKEGDTVELTIIRYNNTQALQQSDPRAQQSENSGDGSEESDDFFGNDPFGGFFGNPYGGNYGRRSNRAQSLGGYEELKISVTLKILG